MHSWGDEDFHYWKEIEEAAEYIAKFCTTWGRIHVRDFKEKWGTVRVYCSFGWYEVAEIFAPGVNWYGKWPWYTKWLWRIYVPRCINNLVVPYQEWIYRKAYAQAIKKWPMIKDEILCAADWFELLVDL